MASLQQSPDAEQVARALAGCDHRSSAPARAQGWVHSSGDYRLFAEQIHTAAEQLDLHLAKDPAWRIFKQSVDKLYLEYKDLGAFELSKLYTWDRLEEANRGLTAWAERAKKSGIDVAPIAVSVPGKSIADAVTDAVSGFGKGPTLGDKLVPRFSTETKLIAGLAVAAFAFGQFRPLLERFWSKPKPEKRSG